MLTAVDATGATPLHYAFAAHNCEAVALLLELGASVREGDNGNRTAMQMMFCSRKTGMADGPDVERCLALHARRLVLLGLAAAYLRRRRQAPHIAGKSDAL